MKARREVRSSRSRRTRRTGNEGGGGPRRRRRGGALWPILGLAALATGAAAVVMASRRRYALEALDADGDGRGADATTAATSASSVVTQTWIAGPAGTLYVRDSGEPEGPAGADAAPRPLPILFIHSLGGNGGQWALQIDHVHRRRRAVAFDLRGHGDSDPADDGRYDLASLADDVGAVAEQFALRRFVLVGHSLGAAVAIAYAARHPERVAGLLLVDPNGDQTRIPREQLEPFLASLRADPLSEMETYYRQLVLGGDRDAARWVLDDLRLTDENALVGALSAAIETSPLPALAQYTGPKLAVLSDMNSLPYSLQNLVPDLPVEMLRGTGHWLMMDRPEPFNRLLDTFVARLENV